MIACSSIEKKKSDWLPLILVTKKLKLIQLPELTARSPVNARFQLGFRATHVQIAQHLVERRNLPKWKPAVKSNPRPGPGLNPGPPGWQSEIFPTALASHTNDIGKSFQTKFLAYINHTFKRTYLTFLNRIIIDI